MDRRRVRDFLKEIYREITPINDAIDHHKGRLDADLHVGGYGDFDGEMDGIYLFRGTYGQDLVDRPWEKPNVPLLAMP